MHPRDLVSAYGAVLPVIAHNEVLTVLKLDLILVIYISVILTPDWASDLQTLDL